MIRFWVGFCVLMVAGILNGQNTPVNIRCEDALSIQVSEEVNGGFVQGDAYSLACLNETVKGVWFSVTGNGKFVNTNLGSGTGQLQYQFFSGDCGFLQCLGLGNGYVPLKADSTYYLLIYDPALTVTEDTFVFYFETADIPVYDDCSTAPELQCGSSLTLDFDFISQSGDENFKEGWIKVKGGNKNYTLTAAGFPGDEWVLSYFGSGCSGNLQEHDLATPVSWTGNETEDYYFAVYDSIGLTDSIQLSLSCVDTEPGQSCVTAQNLDCNISLEDTLNWNGIIDFDHPELTSHWWKYDGDSTLMSFHLQNSGTEPLYGSLMYRRQGSGAVCFDEILFINDTLQPGDSWAQQWVLLEGYQYYFRVSGVAGSSYLLNTLCDDLDYRPFNCQTAKYAACEDTLVAGNVLPGMPLSDTTFTSLGGHWYTWDASEMLPLWTMSDSAVDVSVSILKGSCESLDTLYSFLGSGFSNPQWEVMAQDSQAQYYIVLSIANNTSDTVNVIQNCAQPLCQRADTILCGDSLQLAYDGIVRLDLEADQVIQNYSRAWIYQGDGNILTWNSTLQGVVEVYRGACDSLVQDSLYSISYNGTHKLATEAGVNYLWVWKEVEVVDSLPVLEWACESPDSTDICGGALTIHCGTDTVYLTDLGATPEVDTLLCHAAINTKWLHIEGNDQIISLQGSAMYLYSGRCDSLECLGSSESKLRFLADEKDTFYIAINTQPGEIKSISQQCRDAALNSICEAATMLACDSTYPLDFNSSLPQVINDTTGRLWYKISGDGGLWELRASKEEAKHWTLKTGIGKCDTILEDQLWQEANDTTWIFQWQSQAGEEVWVEVFSDSLMQGTMAVRCVPMVPGMDCEHAIPISCGDTIQYHSSTGLTLNQEGGSSWYQVSGAEGEISLQVLNDSLSLQARWYFGDTCGLLDTLINTYPVVDRKKVFAQNEEKLFLELGPALTLSGSSQMVVGCSSVAVSSLCETAQAIECMQPYVLYASHTTQSDETGCIGIVSSQWFKVTGDGQYWTAFAENSDTSGTIYLYQGSCEALICIDTFVLSSNQYPSFYAPVGQDYYFQIILEGEGEESQIRWECRNYNENNSCEHVQAISCGTLVSGNTWLAPLTGENGCNANGPALYYTFTGDGNYLRINLKEGKAIFNLMENDCVSGRCLFTQTLGVTRHSVLISTKPDQLYFLRVSAPDSIDFSFEIECYEPNSNQVCLDAKTAICGDQCENMLQTPVGYTQSHPCIGLARTQHWYYLETSGQPLVEVVPDVQSDSFKILLIRGNCDTYECIAQYSSNDAKITFTLDESYDYYIAIYGNVFDEGTARFSLQCGDFAVNDNCGNGVVLNCPQTINVPLYLASGEAATDCHAAGAPSLWYKVEGANRGVQLDVSRLSEGFEGKLVIYKGDDCDGLSCFYQSVIKEASKPSYRWLGEQGVTYHIAMYSDDLFFPGELDFDVSCFDNAPRDTCGGAELLVSGDYTLQPSAMTTDTIAGCEWTATLGEWYQWPGDGKNIIITNNGDYPLELKVFAGSCDMLQCFYQATLAPGDQWEQKTQESKDYRILLSSQGLLQGDGHKFKVRFLVPTPNDECFGALPLACGQLVAVRNDNFTEDNEVNPGCDFDHRDKIWYTFTGDGGIRTLKYIIPDVDGSVVFSDGCSNPCFYISEFYASLATEFSFSTVPDKIYYLGLGTKAQPSNKRVRMQMECEDGYHNTTKEFALPLVCGDYNLDYTDAKINLLNTCGSNNQFVQLYYSFTGDGSDLILNGSPNPGAFFKVVDEDCIQVHDFAFAGKVFKTVADKKYFFLVSYFPGINQTEQLFNIDYRCDVKTHELSQTGKLIAYPNPNSGRFILKTANLNIHQSCLLTITDATGKNLIQKRVEPNEGNIRYEADQNLAPGIYNACLSGEGLLYQVRIVVIE